MLQFGRNVAFHALRAAGSSLSTSARATPLGGGASCATRSYNAALSRTPVRDSKCHARGDRIAGSRRIDRRMTPHSEPLD
jgi:hypothetical protein